jgi:ABC-type uncharacterized transport system fused permease/ATPase subunit
MSRKRKNSKNEVPQTLPEKAKNSTFPLTQWIPTIESIERNLSEAKKQSQEIHRIVSPHFTKEHSQEIAALIFVNTILPAISNIITYQMVKNTDNGSTGRDNPISYAVLLAFPLTVGVFNAIRGVVNNTIASSLKNAIRKDLTQQYLAVESDALSLKDHSGEMKDLPPINQILMNDIATFSFSAIEMTFGTVGNAINLLFITAAASKLVGRNVTFMAFGMSAFIAAATIMYNKQTGATYKKESDAGDYIAGRTGHVEASRRQVSALKGQKIEQKEISQRIDTQENVLRESISTRISSWIFTESAYGAYPAILRNLEGVIYNSDITTIQRNTFAQQAAQMMSILRNVSELFLNKNQFDTSQKNVSKFLNAIQEVKDFQRSKPLSIKYSTGNKITFSNFSMATPPSEVDKASVGNPLTIKEKVIATLRNDAQLSIAKADLELEKNIYRLHGYSGVGKSLLLKTLDGSHPYSSGVITFPCAKESIYFMPQELFTPYKTSLSGVIAYPKTAQEITKNKQKHIRRRMKELGLDNKLQDLSDTKAERDWSHLSPGEQQRFSLIRMLITEPKPEVLLMDEATSSVDIANRDKMHQLIKKHLPDATIIYIDHNPSGITLPSGNILPNPEIITHFNETLKEYGVDEQLINTTSFHSGTMRINKETKGLSVVTESHVNRIKKGCYENLTHR